MQKLLFLSLLMLMPLLFLNSQESEDWFVGKTITDIRFKGLEHVSKRELDGIVRPYIGKKFSESLFIELQSKLYALDFFRRIVPNALPGDEERNSVIIEFQVEEVPVITEIKISGNRQLRRNEILDVVLLKNGDMVDESKVNLDVQAIKELYLERGFPDVEVEGNINENKEENTAVVTFTIKEGNQTRIKEILFSGNSFASDGTLKRIMSTKEQSLFSSGVFQQSKFEEDLRKIEEYYWNRGYVETRVVDVKRDVEVDEEKNRNYLIITIYIEEGEQYTFGGYEFEGNRLFDDETLLSKTSLKPGDILNKGKLEEDFMKITDLYYNDGYIYNVITKEEQRDEETRTISYTINIIEKDRAHIENIIIRGNEKTKDFVIRREIPLEAGDIFSKDKVIEGIRNLYNLQFFDSVTPTTPEGSVEGLMDLVINVEEGKTVDINFGVTFTQAAGDFPVMGFLKLSDRNFRGLGQNLNIGTEISPSRQTLNLGFQEDWLFGKRLSGGIDISASHELTTRVEQDLLPPVFNKDDPNRVPDPFYGHYVFSEQKEYPEGSGTIYEAGEDFPGIPTDEDIEKYNLKTDYAYAMQEGESIPLAYLMNYDSFDLSLGLSTGYRWPTRIGRFNTGTGIRTSLTNITYDSSSYRPYNVNVRENLNKWRFVNKWWINLSWDTRDIIYSPTRGFYLNQRITFTGGFLLGIRHYIKSASKAEVFLKILDVPVFEEWNLKLILAAHAAFSAILPTVKVAPVRIDPLDKDKDVTRQDMLYIDGMTIARGWPQMFGGQTLWDNWLELRIPILERYFWWDWFISGTSMWESFDEMTRYDNFNSFIGDFYFSAGGGLRFTIPGLPIGLYLAKRFKIVDGRFEPQTGSVFNRENTPKKGLDFVISFTAEIF